MLPHVVILAGPNGAGKSTAATGLLPAGLPFVNADEIAKMLPDTVGRNVAAGRLMRSELDRLEQSRQSFALETTLANRALAPRLTRLRAVGYQVALYFLWLPSAELAVARVADRLSRGGHDIPEAVIRRRYKAGIANFSNLYGPLCDTWRVYNNAQGGASRLIAVKENGTIKVADPDIWIQMSQINL